MKKIVWLILALILFPAAGLRAEEQARLFPVKKDGKWGYIDRAGKIVIKPQFEDALILIEGLGPVKKDGKWGYVDKSGKIVIQPQFIEARPFSEGLAAVNPLGLKWGYLDASFARTGKLATEAKYEEAGRFSQGLAIVEFGTGLGLFCGYINKSGSFAFKGNFIECLPFSEGIALVEFRSAGYYLIDSTGKNVEAFDYGFYPIGATSEQLVPVDQKGPAKYGYYDLKQKQAAIPTRFDKVKSFSEGFAPVKEGGKWGYIGKDGNYAIPAQFDDAFEFQDGIAMVKTGTKIGYVDHAFGVTGKFVWEPSE